MSNMWIETSNINPNAAELIHKTMITTFMLKLPGRNSRQLVQFTVHDQINNEIITGFFKKERKFKSKYTQSIISSSDFTISSKLDSNTLFINSQHSNWKRAAKRASNPKWPHSYLININEKLNAEYQQAIMRLPFSKTAALTLK